MLIWFHKYFHLKLENAEVPAKPYNQPRTSYFIKRMKINYRPTAVLCLSYANINLTDEVFMTLSR